MVCTPSHLWQAYQDLASRIEKISNNLDTKFDTFITSNTALSATSNRLEVEVNNLELRRWAARRTRLTDLSFRHYGVGKGE